MVRLASDASLHERLRSGARQTAEQWSSTSEFDRLDELLRSELTNRARMWTVPRALAPQPAR